VTRIENIEKNSEIHLRTAQNLENRYTIDSKRMEKLEETMAEQINIIESMNRRQKSFMEGQDELKKNLMIRIQRLENDFISKTFEALDQKFDFKHFEQTVKKLQGDMDVFRVDFLTFKEVQVGKIENIDTIFKKVANDSFGKVRDVESELNLSKLPHNYHLISEGRVHETYEREHQRNRCGV
jgi:predicted nuclease with TOPRIM domain